MYQFAKWKYWLVIIVLVVGTLYALPNVFGEGPALQLSRNDRQAMDQAKADQVSALLEADSVPIEASYLEKDRLVLRFVDAATQAKARDTIVKRGEGEFLVALSSAARAPEWMRKIGLKPMSLGLDLRGGVNFVYEVDVEGALAQALDRMERDTRTLLRDKRIPYGAVTTSGGVVRVALRSADDLNKAMEALKVPDGGIQLSTSEGAEGPVIEMQMTPAEIKRRQDIAVQQNITTLRNRVDELGISEPVVTRQALNRISVQLPGVKDPNEAIRVLGATATLEFRLVDETNNPYEAEQTKRVPIGAKLLKEQDGRPILVKRDIIATGEQLSDATSGFSEGSPEVNVQLDARGGQSMLEATRDNVGKRMAVVYIEKKQLAEGERCEGARNGNLCTEEKVISAATIQSVLSSRFRITGLQATESRELALLLRSGALAAPQSIVEQRSVGPSLGQDNINRGLMALVIGMIGMFVFLVSYYRWFGVIASLVLITNMVMLTALMSLFQATLSLPGIAGIVLTVGMAADANVLIFERIREELRNGMSPNAAINAGFDKAFSAIADSNITTLIAGIVLLTFGSGPVRGFAVTLCLGITTSLFTAILGSRALIHVIWGRRRKLASLPI